MKVLLINGSRREKGCTYTALDIVAKTLNENGMVADFHEIKEKIHGYLDHGNLNELLPFNPTAENLARWITEQIPGCYKATVQESEGNVAMYVVDDKCYEL